MPFSEIELKRIESTVGKMCERRSPAHLRDQLRTIFKVEGYDVTVYEERLGWNNPRQWINTPMAKFKTIRKENVWKLYWMRKDLKWHSYEMPPGTKSLEALVKEVDTDPHAAFFG